MTKIDYYAEQPESIFSGLIKEIQADVKEGRMASVAKKINDAFFEGDVFANKSFSTLVSLEIPKWPAYVGGELGVGRFVTIQKERSYSAILGYIEAIPVIGSFIAIINAFGHLVCMVKARLSLGKYPKTGAFYTFNQAVSYTVHRNHLMGSLLSIVPLAKPAARLLQGLSYSSPVEDHVGG